MKNFLPFLVATVVATPIFAQQGRPETRVDDLSSANTPDSIDLATKAEGDLVVAMWTDERGVSTSDDDVYIAISTDGGTFWRREIQVTDFASISLDADDAWLEVNNGNIYISYDQDVAGTPQTSEIMMSSDLGMTWSTLTYVGDYDNPRVYADGNNLLVFFLDGASSPNALLADTSSTGFAGLGVNPPVTVSNAGGDADYDGYTAVVVGGVAHAAWFDDFRLAADDDLYYSSIDIAGAGAWTGPLQVNSTMDIDLRPRIAVSGSTVHFQWLADDVPGATSSFDDILFYNNYDLGTLTFGTETMLSSIADDVDYFNIAVSGDRVVMGWADDSTLDDEPRATFSTDGGATFTTVMLPVNTIGTPDVQWFGAGVNADYMFVTGLDDTHTVSNIDQYPVGWWSNDSGVTWNGPVVLGTNLDIDEDADMEDQSWVFLSNGFGAGFQSDDGAAGPDKLMYSGIRFPYVEVDPTPGALTFSQTGNPTATAGAFSRWGVSTALGNQVHPENPSLTVFLGPSSAYSITTTVPPVPVTTGTINADGSSSITLPVTLAPGTYYVQGWVNTGGLSAGGVASDIVTVVI